MTGYYDYMSAIKSPAILPAVNGKLNFSPLTVASLQQVAAFAAQQAAAQAMLATQQAAAALAAQQAATTIAAQQAAAAIAAQQAAATLAAQQAAAALAAQQTAATLAAQQAAARLAATQQAAAAGGSGTAAQYFTKKALGNHWTYNNGSTTNITSSVGGVVTTQSGSGGITNTNIMQLDATGALMGTSTITMPAIAGIMAATTTTSTTMVLPATFSVGTTWVRSPASSTASSTSSATTATIAAFNVTRTVPAGTFTDCLQVDTTSTTTSYYSPMAGTNIESIVTSVSKYTGTDPTLAALLNTTMTINTQLQAGYVANP
jgi:hypothetical protein